MSATKHRPITLAAVIAALSLIVSGAAPATQSASNLSAFVGRWQINLDHTRMGRMGPNGANLVREPTFTWVFSAQGAGLRMEVYEKYPQPEPTRSFDVITDAKQRPCLSKTCLTTGGDPKSQSYAYWQMDSHMLARLFYVKNEVDEYSTYAVSTDGKTLTIISWNPSKPEYQNIQVFDKQP